MAESASLIYIALEARSANQSLAGKVVGEEVGCAAVRTAIRAEPDPAFSHHTAIHKSIGRVGLAAADADVDARCSIHCLADSAEVERPAVHLGPRVKNPLVQYRRS